MSFVVSDVVTRKSAGQVCVQRDEVMTHACVQAAEQEGEGPSSPFEQSCSELKKQLN